MQFLFDISFLKNCNVVKNDSDPVELQVRVDFKSQTILFWINFYRINRNTKEFMIEWEKPCKPSFISKVLKVINKVLYNHFTYHIKKLVMFLNLEELQQRNGWGWTSDFDSTFKKETNDFIHHNAHLSRLG